MTTSNIVSALKGLQREATSQNLISACQHIMRSIDNSSIELEEIMKILSDNLLDTSNAKLYQKYLSSILLALVSGKIPLKPVFSKQDYKSCNDLEKNCYLKYAVTLAVLSDHPDVLQYSLKFFEVNYIPPFEVFLYNKETYSVAVKKRRLHPPNEDVSDGQIVTTCYTFLKKLPNEFSAKWDWSKFIESFSSHEDPEIRWMVKECIVILTNMTELQSKKLSSNMHIPSKLNHNMSKEDPKVQVDPASCNIGDVDLSRAKVVNIDEILLPLYDEGNTREGHLVPVKSTLNNLRSLALAVASGQAICLLGPVGSGKTSLVEHLAEITGRKGVAFKKVQLGDQTDSRMLLGSHQCTDVPGEFVWRPGVLTEAVQNGHWLLLEDIDCAALDVASTLSSLLERNVLSVPGYRDSLPVSPGFQLFVTQRTLATNFGFQKKMSNSSTLLQKHLTQINVEPLSRTELGEIIQTLFPSLKSICPRMIEVFMMFSVGSHDMSLSTTEPVSETKDKSTNINVIKGSRLISTRDLLKWCSRSVVDFDVSSPESALKVLQDALDIFTCSIASPENRLELSKKIGTCLGVVETKSEFYCKNYKPNVSLQPTSLNVGRARVARKEKCMDTLDFSNREAVFSFTRQSACLLERIACCVTSNEPVLLVGETGTGKTSSVQYLARQTGHKLVVINMNQQSDSADLLGGYKPVDMKYVIRPIRNEFEEHFRSFYNVEKNKKFLSHIHSCFESESWSALLALMKQSHKSAVARMANDSNEGRLRKWIAFGTKLQKLEQQIKAASRLTFAFIEGSLVKAMQEGHWVLLDEINLASAEILECLAGLLEDKNESIELLEKGDKVPIKRHPEFTLFACMNPATDVGKKDLPVGLRNRFTEFFIDELTERNDLMLLIGDYLYHMNLSGAVLEAIYVFYSSIKKEAKCTLVDGAGNAPHYSLRTLCRALSAAAAARCGSVARSLHEAFCLAFLTQLDSNSHPKVEAMIAKAVIGKKNFKSVTNQLIPEPQVPGQSFLLFEGHWIPQGKLDIAIPEGYILTPTVRKNLRDIARIISLGRLPVLLQGDTSVGKTSLITYIAKASGNYCVRINNHEHTDLQEYIGSYATDASGKLVFKEGVLVEAMRKGYWIILDELNLAPSDVLEALNRVLDDNRELYIPETQQVVRADPNFMLFATQNPPGLYGGRKMLSRAFRNRFVELHFDEIPRAELETILHQRCHVPPAYSKKMIAVMAELQVRRRGSAAVQGKDGFITLRDLFRWGQRYKLVSKDHLTEDKFYDWDQHIADEGYLILAGKVRQKAERSIIEQVIEKHIKRKVDPDNLFTLHSTTSPVTKSILEIIVNNRLQEFSHVVWTYNMRRLAVLIAKSFSFNEPVLLVGETGCGKTTICQILSALRETALFTVNCHMHTESSDFLGGLRPVRQYKNDGRLFEWVDGPLIKAMEAGHMFLADEISLADDSVLERMNSLLEPERQLVLAERGMDDSSDIVVVTAVQNFHFVGTMNPGGDYGKKELSPALRNRFTEIWCDSVSTREDLHSVLEKSVNKEIFLGNQQDGSSGIGNCILDFVDWLKNSEVTNKFPFSIRDLLSWVHFINVTVGKGLLSTSEAYVHGACMTFLDCFGTALTGHIDSEVLHLLRTNAINYLLNQVKKTGNDISDNLKDILCNKQSNIVAEIDTYKFGIKPFYIETKPSNKQQDVKDFTFTAPTTGSNTLRLLRGLQLNKAILLEGNPGVGKTSLVTALAKASGHKVVRINLSDQTDITDLFGTDLPTEDGSFTFKEGVFLNALQNGDWILLDELNLAPQPVLEGLNACLDHRGEVYIPELGKTFKVKEQTRLFACQNPLKQGGARRGLPISFLNRFTQVYIDTLTQQDLKFIVESQYPSIPKDILHRIVKFNCKVAYEISVIQSWAHRGAPWEMNLRDIQRWCESIVGDQENGEPLAPGKFVDILYVNRMRTADDKQRMCFAYDEVFCPEYPRSDTTPQFLIDDSNIVIGDVTLQRNTDKASLDRSSNETNMLVLRNQLSTLKALAQSIKMNWLSILVGPTATGKSSIIQVLANLTGNQLHVIPVTSAMDVSDLLGGFEQVDYNRNLENLFDKLETLTVQVLRNYYLSNAVEKWRQNKLLTNLHDYKMLQIAPEHNYANEQIQLFNTKLQHLKNHCDNLQPLIQGANSLFKKYTDIVDSLKTLKNKVMKATSVNAGGKFEWIDSLLVRTMLEGSWLLIDNVNLTSAAVLDRLNGLLEPNGVLSIPERGELSELTPHPNFRIFFTMDPKYGEISRAMRNRGVEIFLLRPEDADRTLVEILPYLDLVALLSTTGLPGDYNDICIQCHELMTSFIQGLERPTVSHLLQAAHLTSQQLSRGVQPTTALVNSFSDVYIKPRCGGDFSSNITSSLSEMKNNMLKALQTALDGRQPNATNITPDHTLTVKGLCRDSNFELAKQIAFLPSQLTKNSVQNLFNILTTYQKTPMHLVDLVYDILKAVQNGSIDYCFNVLNQIACEKSQKLSNNDDGYKRFYPEAYKLNQSEVTVSNVKTVLLYSELLKCFTQNLMPQNNFSALDYSKAVLAGNLTDDFVEYPILKYCQYYLQVVDEFIGNAILSTERYLDDDKACRMMQLLNWRSRFIKICSTPIFVTLKNKRTPILKEEIVPLLYMHSKWLQKHLLLEIFKTLPPNNSLHEEFKNTTKDLISHSDLESAVLTKLGKKLRKLCCEPKLYGNEEEYDLVTAREHLFKKFTLDLNQPIDKQIEKLFVDKSVLSNIELGFDVPSSSSLQSCEEYLTKSLENLKAVQKNNLEPKLLPINAYIIQGVLNNLKIYIFDIVNKLQNYKNVQLKTSLEKDLLDNVVQLTKVTKGFPPALLNLLQVVERLRTEETNEVLQKLSSLPVSFWNAFYKECLNSPAFYPLHFLGIKDETVEEAPINTKRLSPNLPLLPYYIQKMTVFGNDAHSHSLAYKTVSLQDRTEYSILLENILNILWKNIATADTVSSHKHKIDAEFEIKKFDQLIYYLNHIIKNNSEDDMNTTEITIESIQTSLVTGTDKSIIDSLTEANRIHTLLKGLKDQNPLTGNGKLLMKIYTAQMSLLTSLLYAKVMADVSPVDHVEKYRLRAIYIDEDVNMFDTLLSSYYMHGCVSGTITDYVAPDALNKLSANRESLKKVHPYCSIIMELKEQTIAKMSKYSSGNTFRPKEPSYNSFVKDCKHFTKSVLSSKTVSELSKNLLTITKALYESVNQNTLNTNLIRHASITIKETTSWLFSVQSFSKKIESTFTEAFPDLAKPLLLSLSQISYSVTNLNDLVKELVKKCEQGSALTRAVEDIMTYPMKVPKSEENERHMSRFISKEFVELLTRNVLLDNDSQVIVDSECLEVLKMNLTELKMHCYAKESTCRDSFSAILTTLDGIVKAWDKQQRDIEKKKIEDEALYVTKSKCEDVDEEQQNLEEIRQMFPSYSDQDFYEFKQNTLEQNLTKPTTQETSDRKARVDSLISQEDVSLVYNWHSKFVRNMTKAEWLPLPKKVAGIDVVASLMQRYTTFSRIIQNGWEALDSDMEGKLTPTLMVLISQIKERVDGFDCSLPKKEDFYHSPWVSESRQCYPLLLKVRDSVNELLDQWPDFPTLKDIMLIVTRILSFPVTSPVSRFLTGLELMRDKIEEWNKQAHKGNNLIELSLEVGQQIVNWRKLEMVNWKECLNNLFIRKQSEAHKYWFHLYSVVDSYINPRDSDNEATSDRVIAVLRDFMEKSNLAEFDSRLDIIYVYHCHLVHLEPSKRRDELLSILWNTHSYYAQFSPTVTAHLKEKRAPIEKKLRDFVKICTWDRDLSYWSVKDTVEKAHKALYKHTKEFEEVLKQPVSPCLVDTSTDVTSDHVGIWDRPKRASISPNTATGGAYMIDTANFMVLARNIKKYLDQAEQPCTLAPETSLLSKVSPLLNKAKTLCKDTIANTGYPALVQSLDDFVTIVIETSNHLSGLEVEASAPKEKQTSQAKNILQQKRKALADLFRYLTKMGLNYRTGLVILAAATEDLYDFKIAPVDLDAALSYLKNRRCDATLSLLWSGCDKYFQKNIARHKYLSQALLAPNPDLGLQNVERCKGFAAQLLKITNSQKKSISKDSRRMCDLRNLSNTLTSILDIETDTNITTMSEKVHTLTQFFGNAHIVLEQFLVVLKSCPEQTVSKENEPYFDAVLSDSPIVRCFRNTDEWNNLNKRIKSLLSQVNKQKTSLSKLRNVTPKVIGECRNLPLIAQNYIDVTNEATDTIQNFKTDIDEILMSYQFKLKYTEGNNTTHPILQSLVSLSEHIDETITKLDDLQKPCDVSMEDISESELVSGSEDVIATMLLIIQSVYKKHLPETTKASNEILNAIDEIIQQKSDTSESKEILEDNHLKDLLQEKLSSDVKSLQIESLNNKLHTLINNYVQYAATGKDVVEIKNVLTRLVPILEQTLLFVQYFVTQKVAVHRVSCKMLSVLLKIFSDLTTKGFCKPSDVDMEGEGEGGEGKLTGGTGLGEGEGQKDVSDRIENQDQLDDAHRPGEEKKEEERDCKEEEKGVNMTDDFDSHLQDVDKKDGDQSDQEDDDEDPDKQMGDIDNAADKLDQQIWGSEDEEEENDEDQQNKKDKEEKGSGESTGEKEMAAKEESEAKDDGDEGKDKKKKKDINEMDEPEVDDDHVDPYHGNQQPLPEPEDFEMPDDMNLDGEEPADDKDGETETENPFEIDVTKDNLPEEPEEDKNNAEDKNNGLEVSSDEEDNAGDQEDETAGDDNALDQEENSKEDKDNPEDDSNLEDSNKDPETAETQPEEQEEARDENDENNDVPQNPDKINEEDEVEQKDNQANPQANPSNDDTSVGDKAENADADSGTNDNVETNEEQAKDKDAAPYEQAQEQVGDERQAAGRSELDDSDRGHRGKKQAASRASNSAQDNKRKENKPGQTEENRTLGDINDKKKKQSKTLSLENAEEEGEEAEGDDEDKDGEADAYQHVKQAKKDDMQAIDSATKDQAEQQPTLQQEDDEEAEKLKEDDDLAMDVDDDSQVEKAEKERTSEKTQDKSEKDPEKSGKNKDGADEPTGETGVEVEGENVGTATVPRGNETTFHTSIQDVQQSEDTSLSIEQYIQYRDTLNVRQAPFVTSAVWRSLWTKVGRQAAHLTERLRLVLEPTGRSRLTGDYRTGRAINMRRVIPYVASQFRKDRIWLRRTKPAKREYKIAIAVDDSSSMNDNRSKELAFESLALVSQALNLLESGELAVLSFGEQANLLHAFNDQFSEHSGGKILEQLLFNQTKTKIAQLLDFCSVMFEEQAVRSDALNAKLLIVVSDGRGIFSEGEATVIRAVRRARQLGIFLVYVIIDNPDNKDSIMDIRRPLFDPTTNSLSGFVPYLDTFPFPFYLILRDMAALPTVLGDALRQWFELAANNAS